MAVKAAVPVTISAPESLMPPPVEVASSAPLTPFFWKTWPVAGSSSGSSGRPSTPLTGRAVKNAFA